MHQLLFPTASVNEAPNYLQRSRLEWLLSGYPQSRIHPGTGRGGVRARMPCRFGGNP